MEYSRQPEKKIEISIYFSITNLNINSVGSLIKTETGSFN